MRRLEKKILCPWWRKILVIRGRVVLSVSIYPASLYTYFSFIDWMWDLEWKWILIRANFIWSGDKEKRKIWNLVNWRTVCFARISRSGILDLEIVNIAFLSKFLWKWFNENDLWEEIIKYLQHHTLRQVPTIPRDSHSNIV
jgi:hypothetical protein